MKRLDETAIASHAVTAMFPPALTLIISNGEGRCEIISFVSSLFTIGCSRSGKGSELLIVVFPGLLTAKLVHPAWE